MVLFKLDPKAKIGTWTRYFGLCTICSMTSLQDARSYVFVAPASLHMKGLLIMMTQAIVTVGRLTSSILV